MKKVCLASLAIAAMLGAGCNKTSNAAKNETAGTSGRVEVSSGDRDFVQDVTRANAAEIDLSRLAVEHGSSADVKKFAQMMVDDHTAAGGKLTAFATQHNIEVPAQLDDKHRDEGQKLSEKKGLEFDKEYADRMVQGHQDFVDKLESRIDKDTLSKWKAEYERKTGDAKERAEAEVKAVAVTAEKSDDPNTQSLNNWAADTYPVAFAHLQAAKDLLDGVRKRATN